MKPKKDNKKEKTHLKKFLTTVKRNKEHKSASAERFFRPVVLSIFARDTRTIITDTVISLIFSPKISVL